MTNHAIQNHATIETGVEGGGGGGHLWVQGFAEGNLVQTLADVALHHNVMLGGQAAQSLEQLWGAGGHKAGGNDRLYQAAFPTPARIGGDPGGRMGISFWAGSRVVAH